jgi:NAD-dependent dihydropyrimidine dehydrogenase PreA subunit
MSFRVLEDVCIGCGACDFSCPTGALTKTDSFLGLFTIDPLTCDDCGVCVDKCPVLAIVPDPQWPVCHGRGCPLTSRRLADVSCAIWQQRCAECGTTSWRRADGEWSCPKCSWGLRVACPKTRSLGAQLSPGR